MTLMDRLLDHAQASSFDRLPPAAVQAALTFITDSVGVGLAGSRHARVAQVRAAAQGWGRGDEAHDWVSGEAWPAPTAAMLNAYQIHNQEFDCVHERAVVHPLATILPALLAQAERQARRGAPVSGRDLIAALALAVDAAATLGCAHASPMRFFRPAMCGALGATLGLAKLAGCSRAQMADALGIAYSQLAGTMQAHSEGSPMLALQVGLASRAAVCALDLALAGFSGPHDVLEGPFGYFELFDAPLAPRRAQVQAWFDALGRDWRIAELSHKPFPTGRAAHGALDGVITLQREHGFTAADVAGVQLAAPPLVLRLVGRPAKVGMDVNYARLCLGYLIATWLLQGRLGLADFDRAALDDPERLALAGRVSVVPNDCADPNALAPQRVAVQLRDGRQLAIDLPAVLGHPLRPLSPLAQRAKFNACCAHAGLDAEAAQALHQACRSLADCSDAATLVRRMHSPTSH
ncbi:MAG: MmgE/PrpD family protein [Comamonadaceae bacterium]|jgi:2-methylcitrate dehydratase PrpD|nr:MmgE/PrpD family protein [Comamonadaceae bacterium]